MGRISFALYCRFCLYLMEILQNAIIYCAEFIDQRRVHFGRRNEY